MKTCDKCKWWAKLTKPQTTGRCRKALPVIDTNPNVGTEGLWPITKPADWCGGFEAQEPESQPCPKCGDAGHIDGHQCSCEVGRSLDAKRLYLDHCAKCGADLECKAQTMIAGLWYCKGCEPVAEQQPAPCARCAELEAALQDATDTALETQHRTDAEVAAYVARCAQLEAQIAKAVAALRGTPCAMNGWDCEVLNGADCPADPKVCWRAYLAGVKVVPATPAPEDGGDK